MRSVCGKRFSLLCAMAAMSVGGFAWAQSASTQSTQPTSQTAPPKAVPKKAPSKPIDPDETAGMRGSGSP